MKFVVLKNKNEIFEQLESFHDVFPNLLNRVKSLDAYSDKLSKYATCVLMKQARPCLKNGRDLYHFNKMQIAPI